ncbi:hypothetical protein OPT61_g3736 [Boeremia exigua]|uniref:Uncharacterized protein n=1 Tax=Boeremia exigua TaxID=749465 RepID=A0ACC2IGU3_9PLEO|nr:hypothetical protein OPT61_g3736 [Boeremia exigua]
MALITRAVKKKFISFDQQTTKDAVARPGNSKKHSSQDQNGIYQPHVGYAPAGVSVLDRSARGAKKQDLDEGERFETMRLVVVVSLGHLWCYAICTPCCRRFDNSRPTRPSHLLQHSDDPWKRDFEKMARRDCPDAKSLPLSHALVRNTERTSAAVTWASHPLFIPMDVKALLRREPFAMCIHGRLVVAPAASGSVTCHEHLAPNA